MERPFRHAFNQIRNSVGSVLVAGAVKLLLGTVRYRAEGWESVRGVAQRGRGVVYAFWHNVMMMPLGHESRRRTVALVSAGLDGTFAVRIVRHFGVQAVRGRPPLEHASSVMEALRALPAGHSLVVTPDGPRGPRYRAQAGAAYLASRSGLPLVPVGMAFSRAWTLRSWDRFRIPKPFARAHMTFGAPRVLAADLDRDALAAERAWLEAELGRLSAAAHDAAGTPWPD